MNIKQITGIVNQIDGWLAIGSGILIAGWCLYDGMPFVSMIGIGLSITGWVMVKRARRLSR